ncbi:MAG: hypothetical protein ACHP84_12490 [Caulobacterales bacterium]
MQRFFAAAALAFAMASTSLIGGLGAHAQTTDRVYDNGTVWRVSAVETKPGQLRDYMKYLSTTWRATMEARKQTGDVISYKVLLVDSPRDHEPNLFLMVEYKNMAVFDRPLSDLDAQTATVFGSVAKAQESAIAREAMRTSRGQVLLRELQFTK